MRWFGKSWHAAICTPTEHIPTPVGRKCLRCSELIAEGESGVETTYIADGGVTSIEALHVECHLRSIIGPKAHVEGRCSCFGGTDYHETGLSRREDARAAVRAFYGRDIAQ